MNSRFSALLLAGGKSRRMGEDKALLQIDGTPLWQRQLQTLQALQPEEIFIAGPQRDEWLRKGCSIIPDAQADAGPLGGLVAALGAASTPLVLVLAIDLPRMTADYLAMLLSTCSDAQGVVPRGQPVAAVYPVSALRFAEECLQSRRFAMQEFASRCAAERAVRIHEIEERDRALFLNMNTPEDLLLLAHG